MIIVVIEQKTFGSSYPNAESPPTSLLLLIAIVGGKVGDIMGLVSQNVSIRITNRNKKYYADLGYEIPENSRHGEKSIDVNIKDIPKYSVAKINACCDGCDIPLSWTVADYNRSNRDGKTYCNSCTKRLFQSGENNNRWNPYLSDQDRLERRLDKRYVNFRRKVLVRDQYSCVCCGTNRDLEVHHLDGYDWCKKKRFDETNGVTLCSQCHENFHGIYGKGNNTKEEFEEWIGYVMDYLSKYNGSLPPVKKVIRLDDMRIFDSVNDAAREINALSSVVYKACLRQESIKYGEYTKSVYGFHFLYLDDYNNMTNQDVSDYWNWVNQTKTFKSKSGRHSNCRKIICLNTNKIYNAMADAAKEYNINTGRLVECCKGIKKSAGKDENGNALKWAYYTE